MNNETITMIVKISLPIIGIILTWLFKRFFGYLITKAEENKVLKEAIEALAEGTAAVQDSFIREIKAKSQDNKLTKNEVIEATELAMKHAKSVATGPALEILKTWGIAKASSVIKRILAKGKK